MISVLRTAADAGAYGTRVEYAIRNDWTIETIVLYTRIAARYALLAMEFAEQFEYKRADRLV